MFTRLEEFVNCSLHCSIWMYNQQSESHAFLKYLFAQKPKKKKTAFCSLEEKRLMEKVVAKGVLFIVRKQTWYYLKCPTNGQSRIFLDFCENLVFWNVRWWWYLDSGMHQISTCMYVCMYIWKNKNEETSWIQSAIIYIFFNFNFLKIFYWLKLIFLLNIKDSLAITNYFYLKHNNSNILKYIL